MRRRADAEGAAIRRLEPRDVRPLVALLASSEPWRTLGYEAADWRRLLGGPLASREAWVLDDGGGARGVAIVRCGFLAGDYLELLAVVAGARGRGLGARLLAHAEAAVFARARNFFVSVSDFNHDARRFYRRRGYRQVGRLDDLLIAGSAELLLRKTSGPARLNSGRSSRPSARSRRSPGR
ncbi:MAG: GNAT family N-acetyltransferase [Deltaproteobacteria bacterium]|nr:GNAT family N-acetyltransferase [Deltaproteobacteria bacterium]